MKQSLSKFNHLRIFSSNHTTSSLLDIHSKIESSFLEKYFRFNITDYFSDTFLSMADIYSKKIVKSKPIKHFLQQAYIVAQQFNVQELSQSLATFYGRRSECKLSGQIEYSFKLLFCNSGAKIVHKDEVVLMEVKMKAEVQTIETLPHQVFQQFNHNITTNPREESNYPQLFSILTQHCSQSITLFIVYFGDTNFHSFDLTHYRSSKVRFLNKEINLKIYTFYISRLCMVQRFKSINKLSSMDYISDFTINLFEMRRNKSRRKKKDKERLEAPLREPSMLKHKFKLVSYIVVSTVAIAALIKYFL